MSGVQGQTEIPLLPLLAGIVMGLLGLISIFAPGILTSEENEGFMAVPGFFVRLFPKSWRNAVARMTGVALVGLSVIAIQWSVGAGEAEPPSEYDRRVAAGLERIVARQNLPWEINPVSRGMIEFMDPGLGHAETAYLGDEETDDIEALAEFLIDGAMELFIEAKKDADAAFARGERPAQSASAAPTPETVTTARPTPLAPVAQATQAPSPATSRPPGSAGLTASASSTASPPTAGPNANVNDPAVARMLVPANRMLTLAATQWNDGKQELSVKSAQSALDMYERHLGSDHAETQRVRAQVESARAALTP